MAVAKGSERNAYEGQGQDEEMVRSQWSPKSQTRALYKLTKWNADRQFESCL